MKLGLINVIVSVIGYLVVFNIFKQSNRKKASVRILHLRTLLTLLIGYIAYDTVVVRENFLFELSPSKTVDCCPKGFNGMPIEFHYEGDSTRFSNCTEDQKGQIFPIQTTNYKLLDETYSNKEEYCGSCGVVESFCGSCSA